MQRKFWLAVALVFLLNSYGCDAAREHWGMKEAEVDWKALEFKCVHEDDLTPKMDEETEEWYRQGNSTYKVGIQKDSSELLRQSFELLMKAANRGHIKAMNNIVLAYLNGEGVKQSDAKAVEWAEQMVKAKSGRGHYHMGTFLQQGIGVKQDRAAALSYFRKAADLGNAQGQLISGDKLIGAVSQTPDRSRGYPIGEAMLSCALSQGNAEAGYKLGHHFLSTDVGRALEGFQAAGKLGHQQSLFELQQMFLDGEYGLAKDEVRAACYGLLSDESREDKAKRFPDLDKICPLPPKPMPRQ
jgi:TPR repeat protein